MKHTLFFARELVGSLDRRKITKAFGALLSVFLFLVLLYVLLLPKDQPLRTTSELEYFPEGHKTLAQVEEGLSTNAIDDLYLALRRLDSVDNIILVLPEEVQNGILTVPEELPEDSNYFLIKTSDREQLREELKSRPEIPVVTVLTGGASGGKSGPLNTWMKIIILLLAFLMAGGTFYLIRSFTRDLLEGWLGELEIIKYSGGSRLSVKTPLVLIGTLTGFLGSVLSVALLLLLSLWSSSGIPFSRYLAGSLQGTPLLVISGWSLLLGIILGFLASLSSTRLVDEKWTPEL
ncbi:MAG: hypothetical protein ACLFSX_00355 [Candidatus Acetothermia bacterium]